MWSCQFAGSSGGVVAGDEDTVPRFITMLSMVTTSASSVLDRIEESTTGRIPFSVEFFPARTDEALEKLWASAKTFERWGACFASTTYGAGGSNRDRMVDVTARMQRETSLLPLAHLTAVNHSRAELEQVLQAFADNDIHNVLALRGDPPGDPLGVWRKHPDGVEFASELVEIIRERGGFHIGVAAFPSGHFRAPTLEADTQFTLQKLRAGASFAVTQIFFEADAYLRLRDRLVAADMESGSRPLIPSIMPIMSLKSAHRMVQLSGSRLPRSVEQRLDKAAGSGPEENVQAVSDLGIEMALEICERLIAEGVPALHFDTLNKVFPIANVLRGLGIISDAELEVAKNAC